MPLAGSLRKRRPGHGSTLPHSLEHFHGGFLCRELRERRSGAGVSVYSVRGRRSSAVEGGGSAKNVDISAGFRRIPRPFIVFAAFHILIGTNA